MRTALLGLLLSLLIAGCPSRTYTLEQELQGGQLHRKTTVATQKFTIGPDSKIDRQIEADTLTSQAFDDHLPPDIGHNRGEFSLIRTPLGSTVGYLETFRGGNDAYAQVEARIQAVDAVVLLLRTWARHEFADDPEWPRLDSFLDVQFRYDAKSVAMHIWRAGPRAGVLFGSAGLPGVGEGTQEVDPVTAFVQVYGNAAMYLIEQQYLTMKDVHRLASLADDPDELLRAIPPLLVGAIGRKADLAADGRIARQLKHWAENPEAMKAACEASLIAELEGPNPALKDLSQAMGRYAAGRNLPWLLNLPQSVVLISDQLDASLKTPEEPTSHNGQWDAGNHEVEWSMPIASSALLSDDSGDLVEGLPGPVHFAFWTIHDRKAQAKHLGRRLSDLDLQVYNAWHAGLTSARQRQWDTFLASLRPDRISGLSHFTFDGEDTPAAEREVGIRRLQELPQ